MSEGGEQVAGADVGVDVPSLSVRDVYLRPLSTGDLAALRMVEIGEELGPTWRFRGATPGPEQWAQATWRTGLAQYLVVPQATDEPLGTVAVHDANFRDGHAQVSAARLLPTGPAPLMILGIALLIRYTFSVWNFRKLYMEVAEYNYAQFSSGVGSFFEMEGRLRDYSYLGGRYWDRIILAIEREKGTVAASWLLRDQEASD